MRYIHFLLIEIFTLFDDTSVFLQLIIIESLS